MAKDGSAKTDAMRRAREEKFRNLANSRSAEIMRSVMEMPDDVVPLVAAEVAHQDAPIDLTSAKGRRRAKAQKAQKAAQAAVAPKRATSEDEGECSVCGKICALRNGLIAMHQKGLGKACPGAKKEPA